MFDFFQKPFGLDIADTSIEIISLGGSLSKPKLLGMSRADLKSGIFENGKILNKQELIKIILDLISKPKFGKIQKKECVFSLPDSKVFSHFFELSENIKKQELIEKIKIVINENFPYNLEDLYWDFKKQEKSILVVASPKNIINDYLDILKICKIKPLALENESESLTRALVKKQEKVVLIIDIGARTTNFSLVDSGELKFNFLIPLAGDNFTSAIASNLKVSLIKAEKIKIETGLNPKIEGGRIFLILQKEFRQIIDEIKKTEKFFKEKTNKRIDEIVLAGGSAPIPNLVDYLSDNFEKKVYLGDPWKNVNIDILKKKQYLKDALGINPILFSNVMGLALRGLERNSRDTGINLIKYVK